MKKMSRRLMSAVIVLMTGSQTLFAQDAVVPNEAEPIRRERFANVFDPNSRTYFSLQGTEGKDFGGTQPFASLGATHYTGSIDSAVTLYTGQFMMNYNAINGIPAGSLGAQQRWMTQLPVLDNTILGAGLYVDFTQSRYNNLFQQINLNLELMTESAWVTRFNAYLPVGQNEASTGLSSVAGGPPGQLSVIGTTVGTGGINRQWQDVALMGTDLELGRKFLNYRVEAYGGYYNWNGPLAGFTNGVKGGVRGYITNNLSGNVNISHDQFFGTNVYGGLTYFFGGPGGNRPMSFQNLMTLPVNRLQQVSVSNFVRDTSTFKAAHDVNSGDELHMYFVKEAGAGTGTQTNASNVNSVLADTHFGNGSAMVLLDANGNITSPIALTHDRQQIIGGGSTGTANVDFSVALGQAPGTSIVHLSALGGRPVLAPGVAGNAVTLTNQNIVSGFTIDGTGGLTNGISGNPGASNTLINDMIIQNVAGTGIKIQPSTNTTINNATFLNNGQDILLNAANSTITNITSTNAVNGSINLGGGAGDITGTTQISNVTITNSGGNAILLNNAQNAAVINLTNVSVSGGTGTGLQVTNSQTGSIYNLTNVDILNVGGNGMLLTNSNGTFNANATSSITNTGNPAFGINGGAINVNYGGTIIQGNNASALLVTGNHTGTANFTNSITTTNGDGLQFDGANGTYNLTGTINMNGGDAGIDIFNSNGTFVFNNPLINNTASGMGVKIVGDLSNAPVTTFNGLDITTTSNTGFFVKSGGLTTVNGTANVTSHTGTALDLQSTPLAAVFTNVTSTLSADAGINISNASGTFGVTGVADVSGTAGSGIQIANSGSLTSTIQSVNLSNIGSDAADNGVTLSSAGTVSILGGTIDSTQGDGINSTNTNLTATGLTIGGVVAVGGDGIQITNTGAQRDVVISNNTITGSTTAITTSDGGLAGQLLLTMNNNTLRSVAFGTRALNVTGSNFNSTIINSMTHNTIVASGGGGGGAFFTGVTFDASGRSLSGMQLNAGNWTIGTTGSRVQGDGLHFDAPTGDLAFGSLNIANDNGTGLFVNTQTLGTTFSLSNTSGSVDTTNGAALFLDPLTTDLTFSTVSSTNSATNGVTLDTVAGSVNLGTVTVTNATNNGVDVSNSTAAVTIGTVNVDGATSGINLLNNSGGSFSVTGVGAAGAGGTIQNVTDHGVLSVDTVSTSLNNMIINASTGTRGVGVLTTTGTDTFSLTNSTVTGGNQQAVAIGADLTGILNATINGNTLTGTATSAQGAGFVGITSAASGNGGTLNLAFSNNTLSSVQSAGAYISNFNPTSLTTGGTVTVTDFANNAVTTSNVGHPAGPLTGGILFNGVTFDSDLSTVGNQTVNGGTLAIGSVATPTNVVGDGLRLNDVSGDLAFTTTNIGNDSGAGLYVNTKVNSTNFTLSNTGGTINTSNGAALFLDPLATNLTFGTVTSTGSTTNGATFDAVVGTININSLNVSGAAHNGLVINNSSGLTTTIQSVTINNVGTGLVDNGVLLTDGGTVSILGGTINNSAGDGIHSSDSNLTATGLNIGGTGTITGDGIEIVNNGSAHVVNLSNNTINAVASGISTVDSGNAKELVLTLDGNTLQSTGVGSLALSVGGGGLNSTIIQSMNGGAIIGNGTGGGVHFNQVTFDASGASLSGTQVAAGNWTLGSGADVIGDGLRFDGPTGDLKFDNLTINNTNGTGLFVDTKTLGTTFALGNTSGSITTTGGAALDLDPALVTSLTVNMNFSAVTSTNSATNGVTLDTIGGTLNLGDLTVTNAAGSGLWMDKTAATVTANTVTVNGAADGLTFGNNQFGSFAVTGATNLTNITGNGINLTGASGNYQFADLTVGTAGAATGLNFRNSNVSFQSANTSITGDGTAGSIGVDLSGSQNPNGANSVTPNIQLANAVGQTALINNVGTGVLLGSVADGSAGANFVYGNQTPIGLGGSGSQINVIPGGVTLDSTNLTSVTPYNQGRYEFLGVGFTGNPSFPSVPGASYIFVGATSSGADDGSSPLDRISIAQLLALDATPSNLDNKTIVMINENGTPIDMGANTLTLGSSTVLDTFTGSNSFITGGLIIPINIIVDTFGGAITYTDPFGQGAATLTNNGSQNLVTLGNSDTVQNLLLSGGINAIFGSGVAGANINHLNISGSSQNAISLVNTTGTTTIDTVSITSAGTNGVSLSNAGTVSFINGTIGGTGGDGIHSVDTDLTVSGNTINTGITGNAVHILNTGIARSVHIDNNSLEGGTGAVNTSDAGIAGELTLTLNNNTYASTNGGSNAINVVGSGLNSTIVTSMNGGTVNNNSGNGGGVNFDRVTFDASGTALSGTTVNANNWNIGANAPVSGNGLRLNDVSGNLNFGQLDITNDSGTGLYVNTKVSGTTFSLGNTSGTITTTNGAAVFLDPLTTNMTFSSVSSTNSSSNGVTLDAVGGSINLGNVTVTGSSSNGILVQNSSATVAFNTTNVTNAGADGIHFNSNTGPINFNGTTTVSGSIGDGIDLSSAGGAVTFHTTNVNNSGAHGINLAGATGTYNFGATNINGFGLNKAGVNFTGASADATFGVTDIQNGGNGTGIDLSSTAGNHTITFATGSNIHNVALGVELSSSHTNATSANANFTFGDGSGVDGNGTNSQISATTTVNAIGLNPALGTYNFNDVAFTGTASLPSGAGGAKFVSATAVNGVGDGSFANPYSVSDADANTTANTTFVFLDGTYDFNTLNGGHSFSLAATQNVEGLDNGNTVAYGAVQPANVFGNLGASGGVASRTSSLSITDSAADGIFDLAGGNSLLDITLSGSAATTYLVNSNSATAGFNNTAGISLNGVTMSNAAGSATALQFTNLTGNVSVQGNNINLASGKLLDINGGTATYTIAKGTQPDVGNTAGVLSGQSIQVHNTTGGSVSLNGATLSSTGTLVTLDNNDATFSFLNNTFTGGAGSTLFDIDTTTGGSTTALTFGNTNAITQTQGRIANIGAGARNIDLSAFNFTNTGTTAANVINSVGQTGGTISFGNINIASYNNAAGTAVNLQGSGGTATFGDLDIVTTNGAGLSVGAITFNGGASPTVSANGGTALKLNGTTLFGGGQTFGNVTATNTGAGNAGVNLNNVVGNTALSLVNINGTGAEGILINNSGQVNIGNGGSSKIDGTVGDGVKTTNTDTFIDTVVFGSLASIGGNGYTALMSNGVNHTLDITNSGFSNIGGKGVDVTNSGAGHTVFTMTSTGITSVDNAADFRKTGAGALDVGLGNNSFTSSAGIGLYVDGSVGAGILSVTDNSQNATHGATGGQIFETVTFDANTSLAGIQQVSGGGTTITSTSGDGLRLNNVLGDLAFTTLNITNDNGTGLYIRDAGGKGGSFAFSNTGGFINTTNGAAMDIDPVTMNSTFSTVSSTNANGQGISTAANGINLNTVTGTVTINGGSITGAQGDSFVVTDGNATVTYSGDITATTAGQSAVTIDGNTGGTKTFNGLITATTTTANAINLTNNTGATITFGGGLNLTTTSGTGFNATGGGTVNATQNNTSIVNTINSTSGTALNVQNTTIGASGLTFRSISAGAGANNGIVLDTTGALGGLNVVGNGAGITGGTISGKTGADGSTTSGIGIYLNSTRDVSLAHMDIEGNQNYGIRGNNVTNFTLDNSTVGTSSTNGTSDVADIDATGYQGEGSIRFYNLFGTNTISNSSLDRGFSKTLAVSNDTGTLNNLTITNSTVNNSLTAVTATDAVFLQTQGAATTATLTVTGNSQFTSFRQNAIGTNAETGSTMNIFIDGSNFKNTNSNIVSASNTLVFNGSGTNTFVTFDVNNNTFTQGDGVSAAPTNAGRILTAGTVSGAGTFYGKLTNNTFGVSGVSRSGGGDGADNVGLFANGNNGSHGGSRFLVQNNIFQQYGQTGLQIGATGGNASIDATIQGNTFRQPGPAANGAFAGIWAYVASAPGDTNTLNILIGDASNASLKNTLTGSDPSLLDDVFFGSSVTSAGSAINLSTGGSLSVTAKDVIFDNNIAPLAEIFADDGVTNINLVPGNPVLPP